MGSNYKDKKCTICDKWYTPFTGNQITCGSEECKHELKLRQTRKKYYKDRGTIPKEKATKKTVKNKSVCKGCKYYIEKHTYCDLNGSCDYESQTGRSRLRIELDNGGYRTDACVCYVAGKRIERKVNPL